MNSRPMFPHTFDSTMLSAFTSCPQKMFRTYVEHWKPKSESVHLVAGGAFAKGIEVARKRFYEEGADQEEAVAEGLQALLVAYGDFEDPSGSAKSPERMAGALEFYFDNYPLTHDPAAALPIRFPNGKLAIEFSFAEPLEIMHPVTRDPILYTGRADMIAEFCGGIYCVDEKTTSSLGQSWAKQWEMRPQFTGYQWAANKAGINVQGTLVRGISILKTKYDHLQHVTYRSQYEVDRWLEYIHSSIRRAIQMWKDGYWDYAMGGACAEYGGCSMTSVCKSATPEDWLPMYFEKRVWDPLARKEMTVEEWEASWGHTTSSATSS